MFSCLTPPFVKIVQQGFGAADQSLRTSRPIAAEQRHAPACHPNKFERFPGAGTFQALARSPRSVAGQEPLLCLRQTGVFPVVMPKRQIGQKITNIQRGIGQPRTVKVYEGQPPRGDPGVLGFEVAVREGGGLLRQSLVQLSGAINHRLDRRAHRW